MPFTFSHPAIVLPLTRAKLGLSETGLIIGSIIPDFEYFIRFRNQSRYSHTITGLFWFDVPLAILFCFIFHLIIRNSLFDNLPAFLRARVIKFRHFSWAEYFIKNWIAVCLSILFGAITHLVWDGFTHETKFFVQRQTDLSHFMRVGNINLVGYKFLQFISSLLGGIAVLISILALKKNPVRKRPVNYAYWTLVFAISLAISTTRFLIAYGIQDYRIIVVTIISSLIIALILTPLLLNLRRQPGAGVSLEKNA